MAKREEDPNFRYGCWAGRPNGSLQQADQCVAEVNFDVMRGNMGQQCSRARGKGRNGLYCGIHARRNPADGSRS